MTITISAITAGNRTLTYTKTSASQKILDIGEKAAKYYWVNNVKDGRTWEQVTNQERLDYLDKLITEGIKSAAHAQYIQEQVAPVKLAAEQTEGFNI